MRALLLLVIGLVAGVGIGVVVAADRGLTLQGHDHGDPAQHGQGTAHASHDAAPRDLGTASPSLRIAAFPDPVSGWNLRLDTERFAFAPEAAGQPAVAGEGHAHLYVDGEKVGRIYGRWIHLDRELGQVRIVLTGNDHRPLRGADATLSLPR